MNICMIAGEFPPVTRGVGNFVYHLSKTLTNRGHKITVLTRGSRKQTYCEYIDGITVYRVKFLPLYPFHLQFHRYHLNRLIVKLEPFWDIIHLHFPIIPDINSSKPLIITEHGTMVDAINNRDTSDLFSFGLKTFAKLYIDIEKNLVNKADIVTSASKSVADKLNNLYGVDVSEIVYNGIDTDFFNPLSNRNKERDYILYTGILDAQKGLTDLIKSLKIVCEEFPNIRLLLTGNGPFERYLKKMVNNLHLNNNVKFLGYVDKESLLSYYQNATIYVLPSYSEGFPTSILEAMSCGIPVIGTNVTGTSELIINNENGLLVPPRNPERLAESIIYLLDNKNLRDKMGKNGRNLMKQRFDWDLITDKIENCYFSLLEKNSQNNKYN